MVLATAMMSAGMMTMAFTVVGLVMAVTMVMEDLT